MKKLVFYLPFILLGVIVTCCSSDEPASRPNRNTMYGIDSAEYAVMVKFYQDMKLDVLNKWTDYPETWHGVEFCKDANNVKHVQSISLWSGSQSNPVEGNHILPSGLGELSYLRKLDLWDCGFGDSPLPADLFDCPLETLKITGCNVCGSIPPQITKVAPTLRHLQITKTKITSVSYHLGALENLEYCNLSNNCLSGSVPLFFFPYTEKDDKGQLIYGNITLNCEIDLSNNLYTDVEWGAYVKNPTNYPDFIFHPLPILTGNCISEVPWVVYGSVQWPEIKELLLPQKNDMLKYPETE